MKKDIINEVSQKEQLKSLVFRIALKIIGAIVIVSYMYLLYWRFFLCTK